MGFYLFKLDRIFVKRRRGNIPDKDVVTFQVFVNELRRGYGTGWFPALADNSINDTENRDTPSGVYAYPADNLKNMEINWMTGPFEIAPTDRVSVVYTGTNASDSQLTSIDTQDDDQFEIDALNWASRAAVTALSGAAGAIGELFSSIFYGFGNPVGDFLGFEAQGPCNGTVFCDVVQFTGSSLDQLLSESGTDPIYPTRSFTRSYNDEATHDHEICGDVAETDVTFTVFRVPYVSVQSLKQRRFPSRWATEFGPGIRQHGTPGTTISIKSLLGVKP